MFRKYLEWRNQETVLPKIGDPTPIEDIVGISVIFGFAFVSIILRINGVF
ncbi:MAG: hypothetical protein GY861_25605 [bacterium]|nr:hypothetical protein [bacterium]